MRSIFPILAYEKKKHQVITQKLRKSNITNKENNEIILMKKRKSIFIIIIWNFFKKKIKITLTELLYYKSKKKNIFL